MKALASTTHNAASASSAAELIAALDYSRFDQIAELAERAASYWRSVALAAARAERLTIEVHCRQVAAVTREAFAIVKSLGSEAAEQ
jgi:hypothetical protein